MTSDEENQKESSESTEKNPPSETNKSSKNLLELAEEQPSSLTPNQLLLQRIGKLGTKVEELARMTQHNDELLLDAVANLEMRINLAMMILHDVVNTQVKFKGRKQNIKNRNGEIDVQWYYERYLAAEKEESPQEEPKEEVVKSDLPEGAVVFGGVP